MLLTLIKTRETRYGVHAVLIETNHIFGDKFLSEVYIPLDGYKEGDIITIRHIKDDGSLGEELKGTVVKVDGKMYAKFITTHFSTYALVELNNTIEASVENPPTGDNIMNYTMLLFISLAMMFSTFYIYKNNKNN